MKSVGLMIIYCETLLQKLKTLELHTNIMTAIGQADINPCQQISFDVICIMLTK